MDFYDSSYDNPYHVNRHSLASDYLKKYQNRNTPTSRNNINNNNIPKRSQSTNPYFQNNNNQFNPIDAARLESLQTNISPLQMYPRNNFNHNIHSRPDLLSDSSSNFNRYNSTIPNRRNNNNYDNNYPNTLNDQIKKFEALDDYIRAPSIISNKQTRANSENDEPFNFPKRRNNPSTSNLYNNYPYEMPNNNIPNISNRRPVFSEPNHQPFSSKKTYIPKNNDMLNPDEILPKIIPTSSNIDTGYLYSEPSHKPVTTNNSLPYNNNNNKYNNYNEPTREPADDTDSSFWEMPKEKKEFVIEINYPRNPVQQPQSEKQKKPKKPKNKKHKKEPLVVNYTEPKPEEEEPEEEDEPEIIEIPRKIKRPENERKKPKVYKLKPKTPSVSSEEEEIEEESPKKRPEELFQFDKQPTQTFFGIPKPKKEKRKKPKKKPKQEEEIKNNEAIRKVQREHTILTNVIPKENKEEEEEEESEESKKEKEFLLEGEIPGEEDKNIPILNLRNNKKKPTKKEDLSYKEPLNTIPVYPDKESSSSETKKVPIKRVKSKLPTRKEDLNYMDVLNVEPKYPDKSSHSSKPIKKVKSKSTVKDEDLNYIDKLNVEPEYPENETPEPIKRISKKQPTRKEDLEYMDNLIIPPKITSKSISKKSSLSNSKQSDISNYIDESNGFPKHFINTTVLPPTSKNKKLNKSMNEISKNSQYDQSISYHEPIYTSALPLLLNEKRSNVSSIHSRISYYEPLTKFRENEEVKSDLFLSGIISGKEDSYKDKKSVPPSISNVSNSEMESKLEPIEEEEIEYNDQSLGQRKHIVACGVKNKKNNNNNFINTENKKNNKIDDSIHYYEPLNKLNESNNEKEEVYDKGVIKGITNKKDNSITYYAPLAILNNNNNNEKEKVINNNESSIEYIDPLNKNRNNIYQEEVIDYGKIKGKNKSLDSDINYIDPANKRNINEYKEDIISEGIIKGVKNNNEDISYMEKLNVQPKYKNNNSMEYYEPLNIVPTYDNKNEEKSSTIGKKQNNSSIEYYEPLNRFRNSEEMNINGESGIISGKNKSLDSDISYIDPIPKGKKKIDNEEILSEGKINGVSNKLPDSIDYYDNITKQPKYDNENVDFLLNGTIEGLKKKDDSINYMEPLNIIPQQKINTNESISGTLNGINNTQNSENYYEPLSKNPDTITNKEEEKKNKEFNLSGIIEGIKEEKPKEVSYSIPSSDNLSNIFVDYSKDRQIHEVILKDINENN